METLRRITSRPQAKPYRTRALDRSREIHFDERGLLTFSPGDVENPKEWSRARRWYITLASIVLVMNASMASSSPSGCLPSIMEDLGVSMELAESTVTFFLLGFTSGPCLWGESCFSFTWIGGKVARMFVRVPLTCSDSVVDSRLT